MKRIIGLILILCIVLPGLSCGSAESEPDGYKVYYLNTAENKLEFEIIKPIDDTATALTSELFKILQTDEWIPGDGHSLFNSNLTLDDYTLKNNIVTVSLKGDFASLEQSKKLLTEAGIVKTFQQTEEIDGVRIMINGVPLLDSEGNETGIFSADDFVENNGAEINTYLNARVELYFLSPYRDELRPEARKVYFSSNVQLQQVVLEELIKGPRSSDLDPILPHDLNFISVTIQEDICYVNFDSGFASAVRADNCEFIIYSIVNSISATCGIDKTQFSINGSTDVVLAGSVSLEKVFEPNWDLVAGGSGS